MFLGLEEGELVEGVGGRWRGGPTSGICVHSLERILLISPVRMLWFAAESWGRRRRAKIMNAFMGRFGVPSALRVWEVRAWYGSSAGAIVGTGTDPRTRAETYLARARRRGRGLDSC